MSESPHTDALGQEVLDEDECYELLRSVPVGRVGFVAEGEVEVLPVNYIVDEGPSIVYRTGWGRKLGNAAARARVTFEVDDYAATSHSGWSVVVKGVADIITEKEEVERLMASALDPWASKATSRPQLVRITPDTVTGRRISR